MQIVFHGHSFIEIIRESGSILIDPFVTNNPKCDISLDELFGRNITHIIITHGHRDHVGDTVVLKSRCPDAKIITTYGLANYLHDTYSIPCEGYGIGGSYADAWCTVKFFIAYHDGSILGSNIYAQPAGVLIGCDNFLIYHAGDTALTKDMELLSPYHIDVAFLPIGGKYTMDSADAVIATSMIQPRFVIPIHYNTWPNIAADHIEFARQIMLYNYSVPKVLGSGQYIVLGES